MRPSPRTARTTRRHVLRQAAGWTALGLLGHPSKTLAASTMPTGAANFYVSDRVDRLPVRFRNPHGLQLAGNLFVPHGLDRRTRHPALVVGHPMGAVKEQSANLYATLMAERGFVTLSFDLPFWGESEGQPRQAVLPDLYADAFSAAVDHLSSAQPFVDGARIGAIGVCASGGFVLSAAKIDPRLRAIATASLVDMGGAARMLQTPQQRRETVALAAAQREAEARGAAQRYTGGTVHTVDADTSPMQREFHDFYRTPRGAYTPPGASPELTTHPTLSSDVRFLNFYPLQDLAAISPRPLLFIAGEHAVSRGMSEQAWQLAAEPRQLLIVPGASHVDLYDRVDLIPIDALSAFFRQHL